MDLYAFFKMSDLNFLHQVNVHDNACTIMPLLCHDIHFILSILSPYTDSYPIRNGPCECTKHFLILNNQYILNPLLKSTVKSSNIQWCLPFSVILRFPKGIVLCSQEAKPFIQKWNLVPTVNTMSIVLLHWI